MLLTLYAVNIRGAEEKRLAPCKLLLTPERASRVDRFHFEVDRVRGILGETLLRRVVTETAGLRNEQLSFARTQRGKPFLTGPAEGIHFNLSHAGDWIVCGIAPSPIGVDVEHVREREITFASSVLSFREYAQWQALPKDMQARAFYRLWTLKESYAKYRGEGLYLDFSTLETKEEAPGWWTIAQDNDSVLFSRFLTPDDPLTLCAERSLRKEMDRPVIMVSVEQLTEFASRSLEGLA